jgi:TRAP-type C4-dicarboxylate transport system permease small subunit
MPTRPTRTKVRDAVALMALLGTWLVMPPMLDVVNQPTSVLGIPTIVVYVFAVWAGLILFTRMVARRAGSAYAREETGAERRGETDGEGG